MKEKIKQISIRARVAFGILCLENALDNLELKSNWQKVLEVLWIQTDIEYVDEWLYIVSKIMPDCILEDNYEDNKIISLQDYNTLKLLYSSSPKYILELIEFVFEIGTIELYGKIMDYSEKTTQMVLEIIRIMEINKINYPELKLFDKYSILENNGWGRRFTKEQIFNNYN